MLGTVVVCKATRVGSKNVWGQWGQWDQRFEFFMERQLWLDFWLLRQGHLVHLKGGYNVTKRPVIH